MKKRMCKRPLELPTVDRNLWDKKKSCGGKSVTSEHIASVLEQDADLGLGFILLLNSKWKTRWPWHINISFHQSPRTEMTSSR